MREGMAIERFSEKRLLNFVRKWIFQVSMVLENHGRRRVICPSFWHGFPLRQLPPD